MDVHWWGGLFSQNMRVEVCLNNYICLKQLHKNYCKLRYNLSFVCLFVFNPKSYNLQCQRVQFRFKIFEC